jgi:hypothetical protein
MSSRADAVANDGTEDDEHADQHRQVREMRIVRLGGVVARRSAEADEQIGEEGDADDECPVLGSHRKALEPAEPPSCLYH